MFIILKSNITADTSIFVFSREKLHDSKVTFVFSTPERYWETKPLMKMGDLDVCKKKKQ
jgi:hypothetical protein